MNKRVLVWFTIFILGILLGQLLLNIRVDYSIEGARILPLAMRCELWILEKPFYSEKTIALACPRIDLIRLWPLPMIQPWDEDSIALDVIRVNETLPDD